MELGTNIRVTFFFTLCLTWHIMTKYGAKENGAGPMPNEKNTSCVNGIGCLDSLERQENVRCFDLGWFWGRDRGLGWDNLSDERISTFDFFYVTNAVTCALLLVFIIR